MGLATVSLVAKKTVQRSVRFQPEIHDFVERIASEMHSRGVLADGNFSTALNMLLRLTMQEVHDLRDAMGRLLGDDGPGAKR